MKRWMQHIATAALALCLTTAVSALPQDEVRLATGETWRGELSDNVKVTFVEQGVEQTMTGAVKKIEDLYIIVHGPVAGKMADKLIFIADLRKMQTTEAMNAEQKTGAAGRDRAGATSRTDVAQETAADPNAPGVFYMKLEGPVGDAIRLDEIKKLGEHADKYGPGQIIVLHVESNGGLVYETRKIGETIRDIKSRHRVIAWLEKAISAGAWIGMTCDEIYFMTEGIAGSVTTVRGQSDASNVEHTEALAELAKENGYSEHIGRAMKENRFMCSYTKDPETGVVTFFGDLSGEVILSDANSNLNFNSDNAAECGFSKGTADTFEELAALLDLPKWNEKDDYGRKIMADWLDTYERASERIPLLMTRLEYWKTGSGDIVQVLGGQITIIKELIKWWDRAPNVTRMMIAPKYQLERELEVLKRQLAELKRNRR